MTDLNARLKNRIHATHDLNKLWEKLRGEGFTVYEAEDYADNEQAPYHLYYIEKNYGVPVEVLYRDKTNKEIEQDKQLDLTPFKQEIEWVRY